MVRAGEFVGTGRSDMRWPWPVPFAEVLFAFLGFSALVTEVATLVAQDRFVAGDFFSYSTVEAAGSRSTAAPWRSS